jgi:hypothetical protein
VNLQAIEHLAWKHKTSIFYPRNRSTVITTTINRSLG